MELYVYFVTFVIGLPLVWMILLASNLENHFKQGNIWQIRAAYIVITLIGAHLLASAISQFVSLFQKI